MNHKESHIVTIFGGTGDLTYRKLLPAFYNLYMTDQLPDQFQIVVIGRQELTTASFQAIITPWIKNYARSSLAKDRIESFIECVHYFKMVFTEDEGYDRLKTYFQDLDEHATTSHKILYYFAVSPAFFETIALKLKDHQLSHNSNIIIEKPFGNDLSSAISINDTLTGIFSDAGIYRIDHYIAKEMVQNILTVRFANALFSGLWDNQSIDHIQISACETVGVENRGNYYDHTGALKDMFQNHLLQLLSIVTMQQPASLRESDIHHEQEKILANVTIENHQEDVIYGQYIQNDDMVSYVDEDRVASDSKTETFVALKLHIDLPQWQSVPVYVRTGKRLHKQSTDVTIAFKSQEDAPGNLILIRIQPDEGIYIRFNIKEPGQAKNIKPVFLEYCQSCNYEFRVNTPEAYERLLNAAMEQDHSLFASFKQVELSWKFVENIIDQTQKNQLHTYQAHTAGPQAAQHMLEKKQLEWTEISVLGDQYEN